MSNKVKSIRDQIRDLRDTRFEKVIVEEWIGEDGDPIELFVCSMDGEQRAKFLRSAMTEGGEVDFSKIYPQLIIATVRDLSEDGTPGEQVFSPEDADWLNGKNAAALERIAKVAMTLSGMGENDRKAAGKGS